MLSRFVRTQLIVFSIASIVGVVAMALVYIQVPTLLGLGRITVRMELPDTGALYRFSNVTVRGLEVGKVVNIDLADDGAVATLSLATSPKIPADLRAEVRSISAVGEQYVELLPDSDSGPYLADDSVITADKVTLPQPVGPLLDQLSALLASVPKDRISGLLDESAKALDGADFDLGSLFDSSSVLTADLNRVGDQTRSLVDDSAPLLDGQLESADDIRTWTRSLAGVTEQLATNDPQIRALLQRGSGTAYEVTQLLEQLKPTLPILLANFTSVGQVAVTYRPGLQQLLVLLPPYIAATQSFALPWNNPTGQSMGDFNVNIADPPACTVGFLPPSAWRSPADTTVIDTPDGLYCKLPQDSPIGVRGARNVPCMEKPGKRAPTVEICRSDRPFEPLAMRQHALGPYPIDPSLIAQGIPPDGRISSDERIFGPLEGTPLPPGAVPSGTPPGGGPPTPAVQVPPLDPALPMVPPPDGAAPSPPPLGPAPGPADTTAPAENTVAPSAFHAGVPPVAVAEYDPDTGRFVTPDGEVSQQSNLAARGAATSWQEMLPTA